MNFTDYQTKSRATAKYPAIGHSVIYPTLGLVNEAVPSPDGLPDVVTNVFFGGCSPDDVGMQIIERATEEASQDQALMVNRCDTDCNARLTAYEGLRP